VKLRDWLFWYCISKPLWDCMQIMRFSVLYVDFGSTLKMVVLWCLNSLLLFWNLMTRKISYFTMKWHFSQFKTKFVSTHLFNTTLRFSRQLSNDEPKTEKSSLNTSVIFSIKYEKMENIHLWEVAGALHKPNDIFL